MSTPESPSVRRLPESGDIEPNRVSDAPGAGTQFSARSPGAIPALPWMQFRVGERVVIRYRLADGLHDALREALAVAPTHVSVAPRRGVVRVDARTMVAGKRAPPPPTRQP